MDTLQTVLHEIQTALEGVNTDSIAAFAIALHEQKGRIFVLGEGRSGFIAKAFAMRLMHLGANVYVIGETITPSIEPEDMVIAISGSGKTDSVIDKCSKAQNMGCQVVGVTTNPDSPLARVCAFILHISAATKYRKEGETPSIQPLSSLFDQVTHLLLDVVCLEFARLRNQTNENAMGRHSNL